MYKGIAVFSETVKTDRRLTGNRQQPDKGNSLANSLNFLDNCPHISCIRQKFSREFVTDTADTRTDTADLGLECCQSCQSLKDCQQTAIPLYIGILSVCQSSSQKI